MALDYSKYQDRVSSLLTRFGQAMTLIQTTYVSESYGNVSTPTQTSYTGIMGVVKNLLYEYKDGTLIRTVTKGQNASQMVVIEAKDGVPAPREGDVITIDGSNYTIMNVTPMNPAGTTLAYQFSIRK